MFTYQQLRMVLAGISADIDSSLVSWFHQSVNNQQPLGDWLLRLFMTNITSGQLFWTGVLVDGERFPKHTSHFLRSQYGTHTRKTRVRNQKVV